MTFETMIGHFKESVLMTAVVNSIGAILIRLVGQLLCTLRLVYPLSAYLAWVEFTKPFFIFTTLTLSGNTFLLYWFVYSLKVLQVAMR